MRDNLPKTIKKSETGIVNLDTSAGEGTHWVAYSKKGPLVTYFDSYGNLRPPNELIQYFSSVGSVDIRYNYIPYQENSYICGHLVIQYLYNLFQ
jgi:hypothetical protein